MLPGLSPWSAVSLETLSGAIVAKLPEANVA